MKLGHLHSFIDGKKGATYEVYRDSAEEYRVEKSIDEVVEVEFRIAWDSTKKMFHHTDKNCTAGRFGKACHHLDKVVRCLMEELQP